MSQSDSGGLTVNEDIENTTPPRQPEPSRPWLPILIGLGVAGIFAAGGLMYQHARSKVNHVALESEAKPVSVVEATAASYRPTRRYVATLQPWVAAKIGPQLVSAYAETVLVRPGAPVKAGDVLATLDCRKDNAESQAIAMTAKAIEKRQAAAAVEAARLHSMVDAGFVSEMDSEKKIAESEAEQAQLLSQRAKLAGSALDVNDCVLKAPFDGEVADRYLDPGAFVKPGMPIVSVVDRNTVRVVADVPESDFSLVAPGTKLTIKVLSTGKVTTGAVSRRAPAADPVTRTVHFEIDLPDPNREIPVGTTAELIVNAGASVPASEIPLYGADLRGEKATVYEVENGKAKKVTLPVLGESGGSLFLSVGVLKPGAKIVTEGRSLLQDGDKVKEKVVREIPAAAASGSAKP